MGCHASAGVLFPWAGASGCGTYGDKRVDLGNIDIIDTTTMTLIPAVVIIVIALTIIVIIIVVVAVITVKGKGCLGRPCVQRRRLAQLLAARHIPV